MKKFLTVLLALSVVFTYTVGTAFAAGPAGGTPSDTIESERAGMIADFTRIANDAKKLLADTYVEEEIDAKCKIAGSVYASTIDKMVADYTGLVNKAAEEASNNPSVNNIVIAGKTLTTFKDEPLIIDANDYNFDSAVAMRDYVIASRANGDDLKEYYITYSWVNALDGMKDYLKGEINKIDMSLYTDDVIENDVYNTTWKKAATKAKQDLLDAVKDTSIEVSAGKVVADATLTKMYTDVFDKLVEDEVIKAEDTVDGVKIVLTYKIRDFLTKDDLAGNAAEDAANKAALKAKVQAKAAEVTAEIVANGLTGDALKEAQAKINAFVEVNNVLIDADRINNDTLKHIDDPLKNDSLVKRIEEYKKAVAVADALKLVVEKDGSLKYDAAKITKNLEDLQKEIYYYGDTYVWNEATLTNDAEIISDNFAWEKEVVIERIKAELAEVLETEFYAPEKAEVEEKYQKLIEKVQATENADQLEDTVGVGYENKNYDFISTLGIDTKADVDRHLASYPNAVAFVTKVNNAIAYLNYKSGATQFEDAFINLVAPTVAPINADVVEFLAENGARKNADIVSLYDKAEEYAASLKSVGTIKAEKAAAKALVDALPNVITLADKDAVKAAWEAAKAAKYDSADLTRAVTIIQRLEKKAIDDMVDALPKTLTAADKTTVDAIYDAIEAFDAEEMYTADYKDIDGNKADIVDTAFNKVRAAALADVQKAIAAISANPTASEVEAARAAVDAFVATYTDATEPYQAIAKIVNLDKLTFAEAQVKANMIDAVQGLKIKASSSAVKGKITVKWTVKGDVPAGTVYKVYKSTKAQSGYAYMGKTTKNYMANKKNLKKGKRYFYKVKAVLVVDGVTYTSDWSNKANRFAK